MTTTIAEEAVDRVRMRTYPWRWWTVVARGIAAIVFGILSLFAPTRAFVSLVVLFGAYVLLDGALAFGFASQERARQPPAMIARGLISVGAGLLAIGWPDISTYTLLLVIAAWAFGSGAIEIVMALQLRKRIEHEWLLGLEGMVSVGFGVLLLLSPLAGAVVLGLWVGAYALVFGGMLVETGMRLRTYALANP